MSAFIAMIAFVSYFAQLEESSIRNYEGRLLFYEFISGGRNRSPKYTLTFQNKEFYISKVILGAFERKKFIDEVKQGDQLKITYEDQNSILQIEKNGTTYMNANTALEERSTNTILALVIGIVCSLVSLRYLIRML